MTTTGPSRLAGRAGPDGQVRPTTADSPGPPRRDQTGSGLWRRWRAPAALMAVILLAGAAVGVLEAGGPVSGALDPNDVGSSGAHALAALLTQQGKSVSRVVGPASAAAQANTPGTALIITDPLALSPASLRMLDGTAADLLIVEPDQTTLNVMAPGARLVGYAPPRNLAPQCRLPAAQLAGSADMGGELLTTAAAGSYRCYQPSRPGRTLAPGPAASLLQLSGSGRTITLLGSPAPLTNGQLGRDGDAALALNLLGGDSRVVWLVPNPAGVRIGTGTRRPGLLPPAARLVALELAVAAVLAALWRMRRFGPLVAEQLPVVVRAAETVQGHGRLYRARRARGRAAATLRAAALSRVIARTGLPQELPPEVVSRELATRTGRAEQEVREILFGPAPADDAALVRLATDLDTLEGQVLT